MELSPTAKVVLGLVALGDRTGYEIKQTVERSTTFFWGASYGQIYPELERLERAGLLVSEQRGPRRRREFQVTPTGEQALREWLSSRDPLSFSTRDEGLLKLFFADLVDDEERLANVRQIVEQNEQALAFFRTIQATGSTAEALVYGIDFVEWNLDWWRRYERRLRARARKRRQSGTSAPARR
jgi:PadR family transcriptional regulator, regulatory protein AphA